MTKLTRFTVPPVYLHTGSGLTYIPQLQPPPFVVCPNYLGGAYLSPSLVATDCWTTAGGAAGYTQHPSH